MKVLVACEFSGIVREAFQREGHCAWSADLLPTERPGNHYMCDARLAASREHWDLVIVHPPCTVLTNAGARWLYFPDGQRNGTRWAELIIATEFFNFWLDPVFGCTAKKVVVENPIMHCHARKRLRAAYDQIIQPWQFGHGETEATCLWLRGVHPLTPTSIVEGREGRVHRAPPSADRWKNRSRTLPGIADAMAKQWGCNN